MAKLQAALPFSPLFRSSCELADAVSILVHCPEDKTYLIAYDAILGFHIPYIVTKSSTWDQRISLFLKEYLGLSSTFKMGILWRVVRIWRSDNDGFLTNAVFEAKVTSDLKKRITISKTPKGLERAAWMTEADIEIANKSKSLGSPDILTYIPVQNDLNAKLDIYKDAAHVENYNLVEVPKEYIFPDKNTNVYDFLIESMDFKPEDKLVLYREFLRLTFPNIIMGYSSVERFATLAGWTEDLWKVGIRGTDLNNKGGLSFREFMYLICVVDTQCYPSGLAAEARCRIIFRCFDYNRSQKLSQKGFSDFITCLRSYQTSLPNKIEKDIEEGYRMKSMGINNLRHPENASGILQSEKVKNDTDFILSGHLAKIAQGRLNENILLDKVETIWSTPRPRRLSKQLSDDLYNSTIPCNQILYMLKSFTSQFNIAGSDKPYEKEKVKKRFSWESQTEFEKFANILIKLSEQTAKVLESESRLLSLDSPLYIFGDIHGNIRDITCFDQYIWPLGINLLGGKILFLGDYVDRGIFGIEVVGFLFSHKVRAPNQFFLLRGNHEVRTIQKNFTFYDECLKRCGQELGVQLWDAINKAFDCMPLAALIDKKLFCCHGGIPPPWSCPTIQCIKSIPRCLSQPDKNTIAWNLLWNDPVKENQITETLEMELLSNNGFAKNKRRGTGHVFNTVALEQFLNVNNLSYVIRAHEAQSDGYQIHLKGKIITVFSSSYYNGGLNRAACLLVKPSSLKLIQINTDEFHYYYFFIFLNLWQFIDKRQ